MSSHEGIRALNLGGFQPAMEGTCAGGDNGDAHEVVGRDPMLDEACTMRYALSCGGERSHA